MEKNGDLDIQFDSLLFVLQTMNGTHDDSYDVGVIKRILYATLCVCSRVCVCMLLSAARCVCMCVCNRVCVC